MAALDHSPCSYQTGPEMEARLGLEPCSRDRELRSVSVGVCAAQPGTLCVRIQASPARTCLCSIGKGKTENHIPV